MRTFRIMSGEQGRIVAKRDVETQRLSETLYREVMRRGDPEQGWWVNREVVERELGMNPGDLSDAAELLVEDRWVACDSSDLTLLRPISRGPSVP